MATSKNATRSTNWTITENIGNVTSSNISKTIILNTAGTYIDKNIEITATANGPGTASRSASLSENTLKTTTTTNGYYVKPRATTTAGYIDSNYTDGDRVYINPASFNNTATTNVTYADYDSSAPVLVSGGYLYINEGYTPNRKISLAKLVPDGVVMPTGATSIADGMLSTFSAYDNNGALITGSITNGTITPNAAIGSNTANATKINRDGYIKIGKGYYAQDQYYQAQGDAHSSFTPSTTYFQTSTSGAVSTTAVIPANQYTGTAQYLIAGTAGAITGGGLTHGDITTTDTTYLTDTNTGYEVNFSNIASRAAASYSITKIGWISAAGNGLSATGNDTKTLKKYIKAGAGAANSASATITGGSGNEATPTSMAILATAPSSGNYYTLTANGSGSSKISTAGWMPTGALAAASTTKNYYVAKATNSSSNGTASASATAGTASITKQASASATITNSLGQTTKPSGTEGTDYWTVSASAGSGIATATGGSASASVTASSVTVSAGYNPSEITKSTSASNTGQKTGNTATTTESTASATRYILKSTTSKTDATASASVNKNPSASASATQSGLTNGTYQTTATSGYSYKLSASASAASGTATASVTASSASVGAGYNPSAVSTSTAAKSATSTEKTASDSKDIYLIKGTVTNNTSGGTSTATINAGNQIKIGKGYYPADLYYTAQTATAAVGTTDVTTAVGKADKTTAVAVTVDTSGVLTSAPSAPYISITGTATQGKVVTANNTSTKYITVWAGSYTI